MVLNNFIYLITTHVALRASRKPDRSTKNVPRLGLDILILVRLF